VFADTASQILKPTSKKWETDYPSQLWICPSPLHCLAGMQIQLKGEPGEWWQDCRSFNSLLNFSIPSFPERIVLFFFRTLDQKM